MPATIGTRLGRMLNLNAGVDEDEFLHKADGDITPAGAFDLDASQNVTFGGLFQCGYGNVGKRQMLMSKHADGDDVGGTAGWWLERRANADGSVLRVFLDDGAGNTIDVETSQAFVDDGFAHIIIVTIDRDNDLLDLWWSPGIDSRVLTHEIQGTDISSIGSLANTAAFAAGAVFDGTPSNEDLLFRGGIASLWWADEVLPDATLEVFGRFQYYNPDDRRWVSFWTFAERNAEDWNRDNANDLVENNIAEADFGPGPDRCVELTSITTTPSTAKTAGAASMFFPRFRPAVLQEGYFWQAGAQGAPPLRLRRTTKGATDGPNFAIGTSIATINVGRYSAFVSRDLVGSVVSDAFRLYDNKTRDQGDGSAQDGIEAWEPLGKIVGDSDFRNSSWDWASDVVGGGEPDFIVGYSSGPGVGFAGLICVDISDPSTPVKADTLAIATDGFSSVRVDANDPDTLFAYAPTADIIYSFDWSTKTALVQNAAVVMTSLGDFGINQWFVQIGTRLYVCTNRGLGVVDVSTNTLPAFVSVSETDPDNVEIDDDGLNGIIILPDGNVMTIGNDGHTGTAFGAIHVWDVKSDPDDPALIFREVGTSADRNYGGVQRLERQGTFVWALRDPGAITALLGFGVADPKRPAFMAEYELRNYDEDLFGVTTTINLNRDTMTVNQDGSWWGYFKTDAGAGQTAIEVDFEPGGIVVQDSAAPWEIDELFADLGDLDFETDAVGTTPPTGWTKTGGANSDPTVRDEFGLTGQPPGALSPPQSCRLRIVGPDTDTGIRLSLTPAASLLEAGRVYPFAFWYYVDGSGTFDPDDLELVITETGGAVPTDTRTFNPERAQKNRWHRFEFFYPLARTDRTGLTATITLQNSATHDVYIDTVRWGTGILAPLFSGRITTIDSGEGESDGASLGYGASLIDARWDLDRLEVDEGSRDAATVEASIDALLTAFARSKDGFTATNIHELGSHDRIEWGEENPKLSEAISRLVTQGGGTWWLRDHDIFAMPPGFDVAPLPLNDVEFGWFGLADSEDGAELVTTGTLKGDKSKSSIPESQWDDATLKARYGQVDYGIDPNADVSTATQADNVRDYYRGLLAHTQLEGAFAVYDEPRLRPGQIIPVQIEVRGLDIRAMITDVGYAVGEGGRLIVSCTYALLIRDTLELLLPDQRNQANQLGKRQAKEDVVDHAAWAGLN